MQRPGLRQERFRRFTCCLLFMAAMGMVACSDMRPRTTIERRSGEGRLVFYFNGPAKAPMSITLKLASIEAEREDRAQFPILARPIHLNSLEVVERQLLLAEIFLPQGRYRKLRMLIPKAQLRQKGKGIDLAVPPEGFLLKVDFEIRPDEVTPLFMTWDVERAIEGEAFLRSAFAFEGKGQAARGVIAYISNEGSDTVSVIDRSTDRVISIVGVGKGPQGMAVSPRTPEVFVVNSASHTLTILDVNTNRILQTVHLEVGARSSEVVITPDGQTLYVANTALNTVSAIDATSFQTVQTIPVGQRPAALALGPRGERLLVANSASHTVSVIDTFRNQVTATISVEFQPTDVAIDPVGAQAFVTHLGSPRLSIISLSTLRVTKTVTVGAADAALPDGATGRVFVTDSRLKRVSLFDTNLNAKLDSVVVGAGPRYLAADVDRGKIYVVNRDSDSITVIDRASRRVRATIPVGKRPYAIAVVR